jgi:hypothetical protein
MMLRAGGLTRRKRRRFLSAEEDWECVVQSGESRRGENDDKTPIKRRRSDDPTTIQQARR